MSLCIGRGDTSVATVQICLDFVSSCFPLFTDLVRPCKPLLQTKGKQYISATLTATCLPYYLTLRVLKR